MVVSGFCHDRKAALTLSIENEDKDFGNEKMKAVDGGIWQMNIKTQGHCQPWRDGKTVDFKEPSRNTGHSSTVNVDLAEARAENTHSGKMAHISINMCDNQNL